MRIVYTFSILALFLLTIAGCKDRTPASSSKQVKEDSSTLSKSNPTQPLQEDNNVYADVDISPMDMSYFPAQYPQQKMTGGISTPPVMRVIYSRPHLQGRKLFEDIIKYGQTWRLGANEATELDLFQPVTIGDKKLSEGRYVLYAIPKAGYWTIAVNKDLDLWGLKQDTAMDIVRVQIPVTYYNPVMEYFTMVFEKTATGANLVMAWDDVVARLPIKI